MESIAREFCACGLAKNAISVNETVNDLTDHLAVGEPDHETVFGALVFVFGLNDKLTALAVVGLTFASTAKFDLVSTKVGLVFRGANESLTKYR